MPKPKTPKLRLTKAYKDIDFLTSPAARTIRILAEMLEPQYRLNRKRLHNTVAFFGSARTLSRKDARNELRDIEKQMKKFNKPPKRLTQKHISAQNNLIMSNYYEDAAALSEKLTRWFNEPQNQKHKFVICSGGGPGIMEAANYGAKKAKGESIGLNISLPMEQYPNPYQSPDISFEFHYFFIRKFWFFYLAKSLIVFPGGFGTFDEFFELLTLVQTKKSRKYMPIVLYGKTYWEEVINFDAMKRWGVISPSDLNLFKVCDDVDETFQYLKTELKRHYLKPPRKK